MAINPPRTLRLASEFYPLLEVMAAGDDALNRSMSLSEIVSCIEVRLPKETRDVTALVANLEQNGLLEESIESASSWEVPHAVAEFVRYLSNRQRLSSPEHISAILIEISRQTSALFTAFSSMDKDAAMHSWKILQQGLEDARGISRANHDAILQNVLSIKSKSDNRTLRERFIFIHELHNRYLSVLGVIVDVGGEMDVRLTELISVIKHGLSVMGTEPGMADMSERMLLLIKRLREEAWLYYHSAMKEVAPLFRQIRFDHGLAASASRALELFGRHGPTVLKPVEEQVRIARWYNENLFSNYPLEDYVSGVLEYAQNAAPGALITEPDVDLPLMVNEADIRAEIEELGHISDLLQWLLTQHVGYNEHGLVDVFHQILTNSDYEFKVAKTISLFSTKQSCFEYNQVSVYVS